MAAVKKRAYFLIGLPGVGKSTICEVFGITGQRVSADDYIEMLARLDGLTYDEVWNDKNYKLAEKWMRDCLGHAVDNGNSIVWDQTNLTVKSRAKKLRLIPKDYEKVAIVVYTDPKTHADRLSSRPGKTIPPGVVKNMQDSFAFPTFDEGFDFIYEIGSV